MSNLLLGLKGVKSTASNSTEIEWMHICHPSQIDGEGVRIS